MRFCTFITALAAIRVAVLCATSSASNTTIEIPGVQPNVLEEEQAGLVNASSANATWACQAIHKACAGMGTDEDKLNDVLGPMPASQRHVLPTRYTELYATDLEKLLISETSGSYMELLVMLIQKSVEIERDVVCTIRDEVNHDIDFFGWHISIGTESDKTRALIPLFVGRSVEDLEILVDEYQNKEKRDLVEDVKAILSPYMTKALIPSLEHSIEAFDPAIHTPQRAKEDAEKLYKAGKGRLGTDEDTFIPIVMASPTQHLLNVSRIYQEKYSHSVLDAAKAEFKDDIKHALVFRIELVTESFADAAATMMNIGVDGTYAGEYLLSATIVRYFDRLPEIDAAYRRKYHEDLRDRIDSTTSGDYNSLLLRVFDAAIPHSPSARCCWTWYAIIGSILLAVCTVSLAVVLKKRPIPCRCFFFMAPLEPDEDVDTLSSPIKDCKSPASAFLAV